MTSCGSPSPRAWVRDLIAVADCQTGMLGADGWQSLSSSTLFSVLLTVLLTLAVARLGYRLLGGAVPPADLARLLLHIGIVIALATSWQAYNRLIYRVAMDGPAEIAALIFPAAGIDTSRLAARLQNAYNAITTPAQPTSQAAAGSTSTMVNGQPDQAQGAAPAELSVSPERTSAADVMVATGAGSWIAARMALALLLVLGPFAIAASLFPVSAGLLVGWARAVTGAALATLVIPLALSLELQMLEGPVRAAVRAGSTEIPGLTAIVWSFALVMLALILAVQRFAGGLILPLPVTRIWSLSRADSVSSLSAGAATRPAFATASNPVHHVASAPAAPSRPHEIARALAARERSVSAGRTTPGLALAAPANAPPARIAARRGTQIADGAMRTAAGRRALVTKRPEAHR